MIILMKSLNEEEYVKRCISDFHDEGFCSRVIVIDGGSTDYTVQELLQFDKVEVYKHPWLDWYHDMECLQSNIALSYVPKNELCFIMDFDEQMNDGLKEYLNILAASPDTFKVDSANVARKTYEVHRYEDSPYALIEEGWPLIKQQIGQFPDYQCRLIKRDPKLHWINSPHHVLFGGNNASNLSLDCWIIHYEKNDYNDRIRIEKKWLRTQIRRRELGLVADMFETKVKPEVAQWCDPNYWKNGRTQ